MAARKTRSKSKSSTSRRSKGRTTTRSRSSSSSGKQRSGRRKYSKGASREVGTEMRHLKQGKHGKRLKSRKQAVAIGLSKARRKGKKVPARRRSSR